MEQHFFPSVEIMLSKLLCFNYFDGESTASDRSPIEILEFSCRLLAPQSFRDFGKTRCPRSKTSTRS
jgi:hypothetical protein